MHSVSSDEVGLIKVPVRRTGNLSLSVSVDYSCRDGLARKGEDYEARNAKSETWDETVAVLILTVRQLKAR